MADHFSRYHQDLHTAKTVHSVNRPCKATPHECDSLPSCLAMADLDSWPHEEQTPCFRVPGNTMTTPTECRPMNLDAALGDRQHILPTSRVLDQNRARQR